MAVGVAMVQSDENQKPEGEVVDDSESKPTEQAPTKEFKPITSQEELDAIIKPRVTRAKDTVKNQLRSEIEAEVRAEVEAEASEKAAQAAGDWKKLYEDEVEKTAKLKKELEDKVIENLKVSLLEEASLPASAARRIFGTTKEEIEADIKVYLKDVAPIKPPKEPAPSDPGARQPKKSTDSVSRDYTAPDSWGLPALSKSE